LQIGPKLLKVIEIQHIYISKCDELPVGAYVCKCLMRSIFSEQQQTIHYDH